MKQNSDNIPVSLIGQIKLSWIIAHTRDFNLPHICLIR